MSGGGVMSVYDFRSSDFAFEAFIAGIGPERMYDDELRMFRFFQRHPGQEAYRAVEAAIAAYEKGSK
jgi:hypothetical protein